MFNGIRPINGSDAGRWHCYDTNIHAIYKFINGKLVIIVSQMKPNPAGGWYQTELARQW